MMHVGSIIHVGGMIHIGQHLYKVKDSPGSVEVLKSI